MLIQSLADRTTIIPADSTSPLIVGFDGSTAAVSALAWAASSGAPLIVVRVLQPRPGGAGRSHTQGDVVSQVLGGHARGASRRLDGCAWRAEVVEASSPSAGLAAAARRHGATAIVVGSHGRRHHSGVVGTEPHQLLAEANVPVVVIPPQAGARLLRVAASKVERR
jgi:nucleotide-binding universal stress UspA family protein